MHSSPSGPRHTARPAAPSRRGRRTQQSAGLRALSTVALSTALTLIALGLVVPLATATSSATDLSSVSPSAHRGPFVPGGRKNATRTSQVRSTADTQANTSRGSRSERRHGSTRTQATVPPAPSAPATTQSTPAPTTPAPPAPSAPTADAPVQNAPAPSAPAPSGSPGMASAGAPAANSVRPPSGIAADCSADVTDAVTRWVNSLPDGSAVLFGQNACYLVNGSITVTRKTGLTIDGNGSTFQATRPVSSPDVNRAQWHFNYGSNITLQNMTLVGIHPTTQAYNAAYEFDHNVFIRGTTGVRVDRITARNPYGDNVAIAQGLDWTTIPSDITITNSIFDGAGRMGISCVACRGVTVDNNAISNTAIFSFDLEIEGHGWPGRDVRFTNNVISGVLGGAMFSIGAPVNWDSVDIGNIYVAGNRMTEFSNQSFDCTPAVSLKDSKSHVSGMVVENNELYSISDGVHVRNASDVTVRNNVMHFQGGCGGDAGVRFSSVSGGSASGNTATGFATPLRQE